MARRVTEVGRRSEERSAASILSPSRVSEVRKDGSVYGFAEKVQKQTMTQSHITLGGFVWSERIIKHKSSGFPMVVE